MRKGKEGAESELPAGPPPPGPGRRIASGAGYGLSSFDIQITWIAFGPIASHDMLYCHEGTFDTRGRRRGEHPAAPGAVLPAVGKLCLVRVQRRGGPAHPGQAVARRPAILAPMRSSLSFPAACSGKPSPFPESAPAPALASAGILMRGCSPVLPWCATPARATGSDCPCGRSWPATAPPFPERRFCCRSRLRLFHSQVDVDHFVARFTKLSGTVSRMVVFAERLTASFSAQGAGYSQPSSR